MVDLPQYEYNMSMNRALRNDCQFPLLVKYGVIEKIQWTCAGLLDEFYEDEQAIIQSDTSYMIKLHSRSLADD